MPPKLIKKDDDKRNNNLANKSGSKKASKTENKDLNKPIKVIETNEPKRRGRKPQKVLGDVVESKEKKKITNVSSGAITLKLPNFNNMINQKTNKKTNKNTSDNESENDDIENFSDSEDSLNILNTQKHTKITNNCVDCSKREEYVIKLKQELEKVKSKVDKNFEKKAYYNRCKLISTKDGKQIIVKKTNLCCNWDGETFDTMPMFLPEKSINDEYHVLRFFCSPNCALAYNNKFYRDDLSPLRKSLLYDLCKIIYDIKDINYEIIEAGNPHDLLTKYGGKKTIEEFRKDFMMLDKKVYTLLPPLKPIIPIIVEDCDIQTGDSDALVLKRKKVNNKSNNFIKSIRLM